MIYKEFIKCRERVEAEVEAEVQVEAEVDQDRVEQEKVETKEGEETMTETEEEEGEIFLEAESQCFQEDQDFREALLHPVEQGSKSQTQLALISSFPESAILQFTRTETSQKVLQKGESQQTK